MKQAARYRHAVAGWVGVALVQAWLGTSAKGASLQLLSAPAPAFRPSAGAGGDSYLPVVSPDGRYVLFGSTADNLVGPGTNPPGLALVPSPLNVFRRDRTNGTTVMVSVNWAGTGGGNGDSLPVGISTNGRYALFESRASNLAPGDTNHSPDVFLRDLQAGTTVLVSASTNGAFGDGASYSSVMTPDARYVAFASSADNLVDGDTNGIPDVFVRDLVSNITTVVSVGAHGGGDFYAPAGSDTPLITPDGRYIAFYSTATNLVPGVGTMANIYLRDLKAGTTTWASAGALPALQSLASATNALSFNHGLSQDGRFVAFETIPYSGFFTKASPALILRYDTQTAQTDLVETNAAYRGNEGVQNLSLSPEGRLVVYVANVLDSSGTTTAIRVWDAQTGSSTLVSGNTNSSVTPGSISDSPALDNSGRFVVFVSSASDLVSGASPADFHVYLRDRQSQTTTLVDADTNSAGSLIDPSVTPAMSKDAGLVAFCRQEGSAGPLNGRHAYDVLACVPGTSALDLISAHDPNLPSLTPRGGSVVASSSVNSNAQFISFWSEADDLVANDTNGLRDVFVRDVLHNTNVLVSANTNGVSGDGYSTDSAMSADGRYVAFTSQADDLVNGDTNQARDVFVRDLQAGTTALVSVNQFGTGPGNADSYSPQLSSNGQVVLFHSQANDLLPGTQIGTGIDNLFWKDLQANRTYALTTNQYVSKVVAASMTPDGARVALATGASSVTPASGRLYVWDAGSASIIYSLSAGSDSFGPLAISPNGRMLAYVTNASGTSQLVALDLTSNTNQVIASYPGHSTSPPRFSADSRFLAYVATLGSSAYINQVFLYDFQTGANLLVSHGFDGISAGTSDSDSPDLSSDGRFVAYRSAASNLVPRDTNSVPNIFLYDRLSGTTTLITTSQLGGAIADSSSLAPVFSGDGRTLIFESWAGDLIPNDFNHELDVFGLGLYGGSVATPFAISFSPATNSAPSNWLSWPVLPGKTYRAQFKQNLDDGAWQDLSGAVSIIGDRGYLEDTTPVANQRFYRIVAF